MPLEKLKGPGAAGAAFTRPRSRPARVCTSTGRAEFLVSRCNKMSARVLTLVNDPSHLLAGAVTTLKRSAPTARAGLGVSGRGYRASRQGRGRGAAGESFSLAACAAVSERRSSDCRTPQRSPRRPAYELGEAGGGATLKGGARPGGSEASELRWVGGGARGGGRGRARPRGGGALRVPSGLRARQPWSWGGPCGAGGARRVLCGLGHEAAAAGLGPGGSSPGLPVEGWAGPQLRVPSRRVAAHHARQAPALPGTRGRLLREILPVWLQHCLLGERGLGSGPCAGGAGRRRFSLPLRGDHSLTPGLRTVSLLLPDTPTCPPNAQDHRRELLGSTDCRGAGHGVGKGVFLCLPKARQGRWSVFLKAPGAGVVRLALPPAQLTLMPRGVGCTLNPSPGLGRKVC